MWKYPHGGKYNYVTLPQAHEVYCLAFHEHTVCRPCWIREEVGNEQDAWLYHRLSLELSFTYGLQWLLIGRTKFQFPQNSNKKCDYDQEHRPQLNTAEVGLD